jgi:UDP-N-acetylmuramate--alanine ligase
VPDGEETYRPTGFGVEAGPLELRATELEAGPAGSRFTVRLEDGGELAVTLALPGLHNVINALAALAALHLALGGGASRLRDAAAALGSFGGVARRLELKGTRSGARVYDDYAHHPTEVAATLAALRRQRPRRLIAVFQPHLYSRTKALARRFGAVLAAADEVGVLEVYAAREEPVGELAGVSGRQIAEAAAERAGGRPVWWLRDLETAERALAPRLGEGDLLVTLGAGDVSLLADRLVEPGSIPSSAGAAPPGREGS